MKDIFEAAQIEMFPTDLLLRRVDPAKNMRRFYLLTVQRDLFGGAVLVKEWGRIGSSGQLAFEPFPDEGQAIDALTKTVKLKRKKGYCDNISSKED